MIDQGVTFEEVVKVYDPMIHSVISQLRISREVDDFYQIGLIGLWEAYKHYQLEKGNFAAYAKSLIRGRILMEFDRKYIPYQNSFLQPDNSIFQIIDESVTTPFEKEDLDVYLHGLTDNQRKWAIGAFYENKSVGQIAADYRVTGETVKSWRKLALKRIRENANHELENQQ